MNHIERCLPLDPLSAVTDTIESPTRCLKSGLSVWQCFWQSLMQTLLRADELHVWQRRDRFGNLYWQAYDPVTGRSTSAGSDAEMRAWIEELRYRK